jgi:hypothetical protein
MILLCYVHAKGLFFGRLKMFGEIQSCSIPCRVTIFRKTTIRIVRLNRPCHGGGRIQTQRQILTLPPRPSLFPHTFIPAKCLSWSAILIVVFLKIVALQGIL